VAVGAADDDPDLDHRARLGGLLPGLGDFLEHAHLAEAEVGGELVHVLLEAAPQVVGGEVPQHVVGADELGHALPFGRPAVPSAAATSAHIAIPASRNAPLVSSSFFAVSWACTCDADSSRRSHRAMASPSERSGLRR
jgi:hypothetical protein